MITLLTVLLYLSVIHAMGYVICLAWMIAEDAAYRRHVQRYGCWSGEEELYTTAEYLILPFFWERRAWVDLKAAWRR